MLRTIAWVFLIACGTTSTGGGGAMPRCLRAEQPDGASGVRRFWFDGDGRLVRNEDRDSRGERLHDLRIEWRTDGWSERLEPYRAGDAAKPLIVPASGELGPHGELVRWTMGTELVTLRWEGTFAAAKPRPAHETAYLGLADFWHSLHTADRHLFARGAAFAFTGTLVVEDGKQRVTTYGYEAGRLVRAESERGGVMTFTWRGEDLAEIATTLGGTVVKRVQVTSEGGRIRAMQQSDEAMDSSVAYAGAMPRTIVTRYFEDRREVLVTKPALSSCD